MSVLTIVLFIVGLAFLIIGAEALVRGASRLAAGFGVSPLIIGLTVVAFGTSAPELAVSVNAALTGQASVAVGNVVGSNVFNVLFILGLSATIVPLIVSPQLVRLDVPLMIGFSLLVLVLALDGAVGRIDGVLLVAILVAYLLFLARQSRKGRTAVPSDYDQAAPRPSRGGWLRNVLFVIVGLGLLVLGSRWLVGGAVSFARTLGVSELVVGLTIVAAGTSLPEVVTSIIAAVRGERDIAVGNVVGSNIFNLLAVLGIASVVAPGGIAVSEAVTRFDLPVMVAVAIACLPIFFTGGVIARWEGVVFLAYYVVYTLYLILAATQHDALSTFTEAIVYFALPLTILTIAVLLVRELRQRKRRAAESTSEPSARAR